MKNYKTKFKQTEPHFAEATRDKLGEIPEDWEVLKLGDVCFPVSDTYNLSDKEEIVFLNTGDILDGKVLNHEKISTEGLPGQAKKRISKGDILFSEIRPANKRYAYIDFDATEYVVSTKLMVIKTKGNINAKYFLTYISSPEILKHFQIIAESRSGTFPQITFDAIKSTPILMPPLPEQQKIAEVLGALDEKIEVNRKMSKTLESLAQAIFKKWFIDDADPYWETKKLGELIKVLSGFAFSSRDFDQDGKYGLVTIKNVQDGNFVTSCTNRIDNPPSKMPDYIVLQKGDIILSLTGNVGRVCFVYGNDNFLLNQRVAKLVPFNLRDYGYAYFLFRQKEFQEYLIAISKGTAQQNLSPVETAEIDVQFPGIEMLEKYSKIANPIMNKIVDNMNEIETLSQIRDSLLPRLMSGKLRVK